jgi:tRNA (Thr-GGU) A37 N-methylase
MELKVIAYARNGHTDKFGIPRQSREGSPILTRIVFELEYRVAEALRGIEGYSHLWLIWGFSRSFSSHTSSSSAWQEVLGDARSPQKSEISGGPNSLDWSPTVRPPRLGGNKRMGVFATRSPFRPNPIGLSSVRLVGMENGDLIVSGADVLDGTPIYDIKPYLSFSDSHEDAQNGFAEEHKDERLEVTDYGITESRDSGIPKETLRDLEYILSQDPRPGYQDDPAREYKLDYMGWTVTFVVEGAKVIVRKIEKI